MRWALGDDPAVVHAHEPGHHLHEDVHDVFDPQHGDAAIAESFHSVYERLRLGVGQPRADLVEEEYRRLDGEGPREFEALAMQQAERIRAPIGV